MSYGELERLFEQFFALRWSRLQFAFLQVWGDGLPSGMCVIAARASIR